MKLRAAALLFALTLAASTAFAAADPNIFTLVNSKDGKTVGKASYNITKGKDGYHVVAHFQYRLAQQTNTATADPEGHPSASNFFNEGQLTADYKVAEDGNYLSGFTQNATNQMLTGFQPDKTHKVLTISQNQGGVAGDARSIDLPHPDFLVACDYDPSALQMLLTTAIQHPHSDSTYTLIVPGTGLRPSNSAVYVTVQLAPDMTSGTFDGKPLTLKHYVVTYHSGHADLYADEAGVLMQASIGPLNVNIVRAKFMLAP